MKNVIVLMDNEYKRYEFLRDLGMTIQPKFMCMQIIPTKIFDFVTFGLFVQDKKLDNYIQTRDGIIIVVDSMNLKPDTLNKIKMRLSLISKIPVLIVIENYQLYKIDKSVIEYLNKIANTCYVKHFVVHDRESANESKIWFNNLVTAQESTDRKIKYTSTTIPIKTMALQFQNETLDIELWDHYGRLKIVYYAIITYGYSEAINPNGWLCSNWKKYKTSIGHGHLWHYTLTRFWATVLYILLSSHYKSFDELYKNNPQIQKGSLFKEYYSDDVLFTPHARNNWIAPNLKHLVI
jgi:hypothetical protein